MLSNIIRVLDKLWLLIVNVTFNVILLACLLRGGGPRWTSAANSCSEACAGGSPLRTPSFHHHCGLDLKPCSLCFRHVLMLEINSGASWLSPIPSLCVSRSCRHTVSFWRNCWRTRKRKSTASVLSRTLRVSPCSRQRGSAPRISRRWWTCSR